MEDSVFFEHILGLKLLTQYHFNHRKFSHHIYVADNWLHAQFRCKMWGRDRSKAVPLSSQAALEKG